MKFLLLAVACLVSKAEEPLLFSGKFYTIYLAGKYVSLTAENSRMRILMREVKYFDEYRVMSMTFYVRINGKCQLHTVWADKIEWNICSEKLTESILVEECPRRSGTNSIPGFWKLRDAVRHFPNIYFYPAVEGGLHRTPSYFDIVIHFVSSSTILFEAKFINELNYLQNLAVALATGTNITEEMWKEYLKLTQRLKIPTENIENVYEKDECPKWEP